MNKITYTDLSHQVYQKLKAMILNNELKPGEKIKQEQIAENLGVSRTPLHKAFQMLENEMLVESVPRRGIFVKQVELQDLIDAFECREGIESVAAIRAAERITDEEVEELNELFSPFNDSLEDIDLNKYLEADQKFHNTIIRISGNKILLKMELLGNILNRTYLRGLIRPPAITLPEHMSIIKYLHEGNKPQLEKIMKKHFRESRDKVEEFLKSGKKI